MIRSLMIGLMILGPTTGLAQSQNSLPMEGVKKEAQPTSEVVPPPSIQERKDVERVEVTGSHIKRIDTEGASPVTTITRKELEKTGYNSIADVLRDTSVNSFGSAREQTNSTTSGNAEVDLRGMGASSTLVLLNGQRLAADAVDGAVDVSMIPMAAIDRVEILKDGASAIYGSDALGGVVNIITRKDFSGSEVSMSQSTPELRGGQKNEISLVNGINKGRLNMVNVAQYRDNKSVYSRDREWTSNGTSKISDVPSYSQAGGATSVNGCPPGRLVQTPDGTVCTFKYSDYSTEIPDLKSYSLMSETNYELTSKVKLTARLGGTDREVREILAPGPGNLTLPAGSAGSPAGTDPTLPVNVNFRTKMLGNRETKSNTYSYNALAGVSITAPKDWQVDVTGSQNVIQTDKRGVNGYALSSSLLTAITSNSCNIFDQTGNCNLNTARYIPEQKTTSQLSSADVKASGELVKLSTGSLGLAIGTSFTFQKYQDSFDQQSMAGGVFGSSSSAGGVGQRNARSAYVELSVPVTTKLELQLAERYDHYSDFGDTANPKGAFLYHVSKSWLLRGSVGTGFKAPLMTDMYASSSTIFPAFIDHRACDRERAAGGATPECLPQQYMVTSSGNPGLKEERSLSYSTGAIYEPNKDFNIGTDFFFTKNKNVVGIDYEDVTLAESQGVDVSKYGVTVTRDNLGNIVSINAPLQNLAAQEILGFDISTSYQIHKVKLSSELSQMLWFKEQGFPGTSFRNKLGENGKPAWRNATGVAYQPKDRHDLSLVAQTTAGQEKTIPEQGRLRPYTELSFQYAYKSKGLGTFIAGIRNLLGTTPPLDDSDPTNPLNTSIYDQIGRQYFTGYKQTF